MSDIEELKRTIFNALCAKRHGFKPYLDDFHAAATPEVADDLIARLESAEKLAETYRHMRDVVQSAGYNSITEALVALEAAKRDAARYRWIRNRIVDDRASELVSRQHGSTLDRSIDIELSKERG